MPRHYLKVPNTIQNWFPGGAPADWRARAFDDVTERGTRLTVVTIPSNDQGPRLAVFGDQFYFELGRDRGRSDTLFLTRIEWAKSPSQVPRIIECEVQLWPGGVPPTLDHVDHLWGEGPVRVAETPDASLTQARVEPSAALVAALASAPPDLRDRYRGATLAASASDLLSPLRTLWTRHRLDRLIEPTGRQGALLRGVVQPAAFTDTEQHELVALFGLGLLNKLAADRPQELERVVRSLADVPDLPLRLLLWATMTSGLSDDALRRELQQAATGLAELPKGDPRVDRVCAEFVVPALLAAARRERDSALVGILEAAESNSSALAAVAQWATALSPDVSDVRDQQPIADESANAAPVEPLLAAQPMRAVDSWVLRLRGLNHEQVHAEAGRIEVLIQQCQEALATADSLQGFSALLSRIASLRDDASAWLQRLPVAEDLTRDRKEAEEAFASLTRVLGDRAGDFVDTLDSSTPKDVHEVVALLGHHDVLALVPTWMWAAGSGEPDTPPPSSVDDQLRALFRAPVRAAVQQFSESLRRLGQPLAAKWLPPLPPGRRIDEHIREWTEKAQEFLLEVPPEVQQVLHGSVGADLNVMLSNATRLGQLRDTLDDAAMATLAARLTGRHADDVAVEVAAISKAVEFFQTNVGSLQGISFDAILLRAGKERGGGGLAAGPVDERRVMLDHNWIDASGSRASLTVVRRAQGSNLAELAAPLVLGVPQPCSIEVAVDWQVRGKLRDAWPDDWPDVEPSEPFMVYPHDWRPDPNGPGYLHSFAASFPVRLLRGEPITRLEVVATVRDGRTGAGLCEPKTLKWDQIEEPRSVVVEWADATNPEYIRQHPIGPQEKVATLLQRLSSGSSVAVIAPRRFGKSTLAEYLVKEAPASGLAMPPAIWCTEFWSTGGFDYQRLWDRASKALKAVLGAEIGSGREGVLPSAEAFDHVRRVAHEQGFKAVVLLFDEAQLFFPGQGNFEVSSLLKMLLERHWARAENNMAPLLMGFVGLQSLRQRVGADLMGLLNPIERSSMDEAELRPLIAHMAAGLQTTREARTRLANAAGNLFLLRALLDRLATHVNREQRRWAAYSDVFHVEESLRRDLQRSLPESETVAAYVRDVLNEAERVEDWRPVAAFPVAVALAQERQTGRSLPDVVAHATAALNTWCSGIADEHVRPTYDEPLVSGHLQALRERGVLRDDEFSSRLLEAWLLGIAAKVRLGIDEAFREALLKGAQRRIQIPEGIKRVAAGGEAEIIRHQDRAYRIRPMRTEVDRQHYLETVSVLETLKSVIDRGEAGSDHVFEPLDIGLSSKNSSDAVQVYKWVEGRDLSDRQSAFSAESVVEIGTKLSRALVLLHGNNILHRDICPRNIILAEAAAEDLRPVLIDFGFARIAEGQTATALNGEHVAPEVRVQPAFWSRAADVHALGWTLKWLLAPTAGDSELLRWLDRASAPQHEDRPTAEQLVAGLEAVGEKMSLQQRQADAWSELQRGLNPADRHSPWVSKLLRENRSVLVSLAMGFSRDNFDQCRTVADFLYKTAESTSVRFVTLRDLEVRLKGDEARNVALVRALRHDRAHGDDAKYENTRQLVEEFRQMTPERQRGIVIAVAAQVSRTSKFPSLEPMVRKFLKGN